MNEHSRELAELRAELKRTKRWVMVLAAGFAAVAFMAVAPGVRELRADRLVIGDEKHGIVLEAGPKTPPRLALEGGDASIVLMANGHTAGLDLNAKERDESDSWRAISLDASSGSLSVTKGVHTHTPAGKLVRGSVLTNEGLRLEEQLEHGERVKKASWP